SQPDRAVGRWQRELTDIIALIASSRAHPMVGKGMLVEGRIDHCSDPIYRVVWINSRLRSHKGGKPAASFKDSGSPVVVLGDIAGIDSTTLREIGRAHV